MIRAFLAPRAVLMALVVAFAPTPPAAAQHSPKLDRALRAVTGGGTQRVIIRTKPGQRAAIRKALKAHGDDIRAEHPSIDALTVDLHADDLQNLVAHAGIESIASDAEVAAMGDYVLNQMSVLSGPLRNTLGLSTTWTGVGIGVALIDSGIAPLPAFSGRITAFYDFTNNAALPTTPRDGYGHGTHIAGLIGAFDHDYMGVAPDVRFLALKVLDGSGKGRTSDVIRALEFVTANKAAFGIDVVNLSLGHPILSPAADDPLVQAVESAVRAGLVVVVSAGNFGRNRDTGEVGYAGITSPGNAPSALTVGAFDSKQSVTRDDDEVTRYSSRGPTWYDAYAKPDVVAPGHALISSATVSSYLFTTYPALQRRKGPRRYLELNGTSMAAGVATGVVATMLEANRWFHGSDARLTPNAVKALLQYTAISAKATGLATNADALTQGTGGINAEGAVRLASFVNPGVPTNAEWVSAPAGDLYPASYIGTQLFNWAANIVWGENIVWGDSVFANQPAWATNIVWGDDAFDGVPWATNIVWADNIVWSLSDNIVWGENIVWGDGLLTALNEDNIVWGLVSDADNIVWGQLDDDNIVWGLDDGDNIVWALDDDNIVWTLRLESARGKGKGR